jgi:putative hydrolase of the HAD superfamily
MKYRAVVFDLFQTLVWLETDAWRAAHYWKLAERVGADPDRFAEAWVAARPGRETQPLVENVRALSSALGLSERDADAIVELRRDATRKLLVPRAGVPETLAELRRRGLRIGLISNCTGDVPDVWGETPFAPYFDATVFSCEVGAMKPERVLYQAASERLGVRLAECVFVDDNPAFARGALEAGMEAVLIDPPDGPIADDWSGPRIRSPLDLLGLPGLST